MEACHHLGREPPAQHKPLSKKKPAKASRVDDWKPKPSCSPPDTWLDRAARFLGWAEEQLRGDDAREPRDWLVDRGIVEKTAKAFHLGWNPRDWWLPRPTWVLPEELNEKGKPKKLWLPAGLVIPVLQDGAVQQLRIRRQVPGADPRYILISGSSMAPLVTPGGDGKVIMVMESSLDAILIHQVAGDLVTTMALGSAQIRPDEVATAILRQAETILVALDADETGAKAAWQWWGQHFKQARRWPPVGGKDPGEMQTAGVNIRSWVIAGLPSCTKQVDGGNQEPEAPVQEEAASTLVGRVQDGMLTPVPGPFLADEQPGSRNVVEIPAEAICSNHAPTHAACAHFRPHPKFPDSYIGQCSGNPSNGYKSQWPFNEIDDCSEFAPRQA
jgi:DNA primase